MKALGGAFVVLAVCLLAAGYAFWPAPPATTPLAIGGDFRLMHESGVELDTAEAFKGQPMLVYFGYTYCPDVCPTTLMDMVSASEATDVEEALVFVTIDPARDSAADLLAYTDLFTPALHGFTDLVFDALDVPALAVHDVVFLAVPHGTARELAAALDEAGAACVIDLSRDHRHADGWVYGQADYKHALIRHPLSAAVSEEVRAQLDVGPAPRGGNSFTLGNTGSGDNQTTGASFRIFVDTRDWDNTLGMNAPGQSGDPNSPLYDNLFELWADDQVFPAFYSRDKIESVLFETLELTPAN